MTLKKLDAVIIGAGLAGLYMSYQLRKNGYNVKVLEAGPDIGGTWFWNRYPGARCDIQSLEYSYQFSDELQNEWVWAEKYSSRDDILKYIRHVTKKFDLLPLIQLNTKVTGCHYDDKENLWGITTDKNEKFLARFTIMATGCLSEPYKPKISGIEKFRGRLLHTAEWPDGGLSFKGKKVAVIGTGASAVQLIPHVAREAEKLFVYQRTGNYVVPLSNGPLSREYQSAIKSDYKNFRHRNALMPLGIGIEPNLKSAMEVSEDERQKEYEKRWRQGGLNFTSAFMDIILNENSNQTASDFVKNKIREIVVNQETADNLMPDHFIGAKRLCLSDEYYQTFNQKNVALVSLKKNPIVEIRENMILSNGHEAIVDDLVLATGFDSMTGSLLKIDIRGKNGILLKDKWRAHIETYLGLSISGFPNLFTITGPGSPSVLSNMISSIEHHVNWVARCINYMREKNLRSIEAMDAAAKSWWQTVNQIASATLLVKTNSWYLGSNLPNKPREVYAFLGYPQYIEACQNIEKNEYFGFHFTK